MYFIGYDIGSSSVKAAIIDGESQRTIASDFFPKREAPIKATQPGWAEQSPEDWWAYLKAATASVLDAARIDKESIRAIGISYQMHGLVCVDKDGRVIRDAIIWCDSRGVSYGDKAFGELGSDLCLGHLLNSPGNFTASKLQWVKEHESENFAKIYKVMLPGDYIAYRLTGQMLTTVGGLSEAMLWDFKANDIAHFMLSYFGYDKSIFPPLTPTFSNQGHLTAAVAAELGLSEKTIVAYRGGDQPNNALSLAVLEPGQVASTAGTSGVVYGISSSYASDPLSRVNNFAHVNHTAADPRIGVLACINGTGILNSWIKSNIAPPSSSYQDMNREAELATIGCKGLSVLPFGNGAERLLGNREVGCAFSGINFNIHTRPYIYRAAQEGIAFAFNYGIDIMRGMGADVKVIHAGNANMYLSPIFRQTVSAVTGATILLLDTDGAAGAAFGAAFGAGFYASLSEALANVKIIERVEPTPDRSPYLEAYSNWKSLLNKYLKNE